MKNIKSLTLAALVLLSPQAYSQYETSWDNAERSINQISEHVYRWGGGAMGGISGLFVPTSEGISVIDGPGNPCTPESGQWFKDELEQRFDVPVRYVVLSHDHQSHICGTTVFADTAVAIGSMVDRTLAECEKLTEEGISVEVIDPRTIAPLDMETISESVRKTGRLLIVDETFQPCGVGAEIAAQVIDAGFDDLDAPIRRLNGAHVATPYSPPLEHSITPQPNEIEQSIRDLLAE